MAGAPSRWSGSIFRYVPEPLSSYVGSNGQLCVYDKDGVMRTPMNSNLQVNERDRWNERYRSGTHGMQPPDQLLVDALDRYIEPIFPETGTALDFAGGAGRHAIYLASKGWKVCLADVAEAGIANARKNAGSLANQIEFRVTDLDRFRATDEAFDMVLVFFFVRREILRELVKVLRPGGLLIYKAYTQDQKKFGGGPTNPSYFFEENELLDSFRELRVLHYAELIRDCGMAEFVGQKS
jgi:tellurite methyltransferase